MINIAASIAISHNAARLAVNSCRNRTLMPLTEAFDRRTKEIWILGKPPSYLPEIHLSVLICQTLVHWIEREDTRGHYKCPHCLESSRPRSVPVRSIAAATVQPFVRRRPARLTRTWFIPMDSCFGAATSVALFIHDVTTTSSLYTLRKLRRQI